MAERVQVEEIETSKPRTRALRVHINEDALRKGLEKIAREVSRRVRIPGFRPGRAPYALVERHVGRQYLLEEYLEREIDSLITEALEASETEAAYPVELTNIQLEPLVIEIEVPLEPEVDLGNYQDIRLPYEEPDVTDEDVEEIIHSLLADRGTMEPVDEPATEEDLIEADVVVQVGEETVLEDKEVGLRAGTDYYLPGFGEELVGIKAGETKEFTLPIPEDHEWREKGEEARFTVTAHEVKRLKLPEMTLELAKEFNPDVESVEELRDIIRENLRRQRQREAESEYINKVLDAIVEQASISYPPVLLERALDNYIERLKEYTKDLGLSFEQYLQLLGKTEEQVREDHRADAERDIRNSLILTKIIEEHNLEPTHEDIIQVLNDIVYRYNVPPNEVEQRFQQDPQFAARVYQEARELRAMRFLAGIARGLSIEEAAGRQPGEEVEVEHTDADEETPASDADAEADVDAAVDQRENE